MENREQYLLDKLSQRDQLSAEEVQAVETEYQEVIAARQREEQIDEKVHADEIPFSITGVDISGFPVEVIQFVEEVVKEDRKRIYNEHAIELEQTEIVHAEYVQNSEWREMVLKDKVAQLEREAQENVKTHLDYVNIQQEIVHDLELRASDAESKRDAAVSEKEEIEFELRAEKDIVAILQDRIDDFKRIKEYQERQEQPLAVSAEASLQEKADAVKKLFVGRENWGTVDKLYLADGSFQVVKRAEVDAEWEKDDNVPAAVESVENEVTEFRGNIPAPEIATLQEYTVHGEVDAEGVKDNSDGVTRETWESWVERTIASFGNRLEALDQQAYEASPNKEAA